jgi:predicted metalloprotease with PDZ domain
MIKYTFFQKNPSSHYVYIDMVFETLGVPEITLQLPTWRPGRYELGNFAKNVKRVEMFGAGGEILTYSKLTKDKWLVKTEHTPEIKITYSYYAAELNAGACYADTEQMYINPVHCCFYIQGREKEPCEVHLKVPEEYRVATSLQVNNHVLLAEDYDDLVESPFIASAALQQDTYVVKGTEFHLHFNGRCQPDFEKIKNDFRKFTEYQIAFWGDFPFKAYHFLIQMTPFKFYHGVEHFKNTVIALGPGYDLHTPKMYEDLLGVSCHELFHVWNIKTIRPAEMLPYDYTRENYATTGFVYEGFTTYYGDKNLFSSQVFNESQYFQTLEERLDKHFHNFGRYNLSVAASSFETWLDGYVPGAPYRKTNIYDEGCLIALMLDTEIMRASNNRYGLKQVCVDLYENFGKKRKGYRYEDIIQLCEKYAGKSLQHLFDTYVTGTNDFEEGITAALNYLGLELQKQESPFVQENNYGFKTTDYGSFAKVILVAPYSPSWKAGLFHNDEIIAVNNTVVRNNLSALLAYYSGAAIELTVISNEQLKTLQLAPDKNGKTWFFRSKVVHNTAKSAKQNSSFDYWKMI